MRLLFVVVALVGCVESTEERLDRLRAEADIVCWQYSCGDGYHPPPPPTVPIEQALACMNDALASGERAVASWGIGNFAAYTDNLTVLLTIDHRVNVFEASQFGEDPPQYRELPSCSGPFRIDEQAICGAIDAGFPIPVKALAWDGCP